MRNTINITKSVALAIMALALTLSGTGKANAAMTVVTFDDLPGSGVVPDGYGGINWLGNWTYYGTPQPPYTPHSDPNRVYDVSPNGEFDFITPQVFDGAWFAGNAFATVQFDLYDGGLLVSTSSVLAPSATPTFLDSGYSGLVDKVVVVSPGPDFFVMDDVTYGAAASTAPEPASLTLLGVGFVGLMGYAGVRRRKKAAPAA